MPTVILKRLAHTAVLTAAITAALAACTSKQEQIPQDDLYRITQEAQACADSIASSPPGISVLTAACLRSSIALPVLSAAQTKYSQLENLTTDLTAKLQSAENTIQTVTEALDRNNARTAETQQQLFDTHAKVSGQANTRIQSNLDTQSILEKSSEDIATMTVATVQSRIRLATELEEEWIARYTDLETRYNELRTLLSDQSSELLTAQILLDQEKANFDRIVANAILAGTRKERDELNALKAEAQILHDTSSAALTQALADMAHAKSQIETYHQARLELLLHAQLAALQDNLPSPACQAAWHALRRSIIEMIHTQSWGPKSDVETTAYAGALDDAWQNLQDACAPTALPAPLNP